jgi:hypothetical protein
MNVRQAELAGYRFTGIYDWTWNREKVKQRAKELRQAGNRAIMVERNNGISVYWIESEANAKTRRDKEAQIQMNMRLRQIAKMEQELAELRGWVAKNS